MIWRIYLGIVVTAVVLLAIMALGPMTIIENEAAGLTPFDLRMTGYSHADAVAFTTILSDYGRTIYQGPQRILDSIFPTLAMISLAGGVMYLWRVIALPWIMVLLAVLGPICDYIENAMVGRIIKENAVFNESFVWWSNTMTMVKFVCMYTCLAFIIVAIVQKRRKA